MPIIKNIDSLAINPKRKDILTLIESGLESIQPEKLLAENFTLRIDKLRIKDTELDLKSYDRVFVLAFGKGSGGIANIVTKTLDGVAHQAYIIDNVAQTVESDDIYFVQGTHPLPSQTNIDFTKYALQKLSNLTERDLVLVIICGGGSAMFELPYNQDLAELTKIYNEFLKSGANIKEMNVIRKHLSQVKGGGLAKHLFPARVVGLIFSDVPGNDISTIASGPITKNDSTIDDVKDILLKYTSAIPFETFQETPQDDKYFQNVTTHIIASNRTVLEAMQKTAEGLGFKATIYSDHFQGNAKEAGKQLLEIANPNEITLIGGETTIKVTGSGKGGRNQVLVMSSLSLLKENEMIAAFDTDGIDNYYYAGAIGDMDTNTKIKNTGLDIQKYLDEDNSYEFFEKVSDGILTDKLESNVSDIIIVSKI